MWTSGSAIVYDEVGNVVAPESVIDRPRSESYFPRAARIWLHGLTTTASDCKVPGAGPDDRNLGNGYRLTGYVDHTRIFRFVTSKQNLLILGSGIVQPEIDQASNPS